MSFVKTDADDTVGRRFDPTARPTPLKPRQKTFEDGLIAAYQTFEMFRKNPNLHWVTDETMPLLCKYRGKRNCLSCKGRVQYTVANMNLQAVLCSHPFPARNPMEVLMPGTEFEERPGALTDRL